MIPLAVSILGVLYLLVGLKLAQDLQPFDPWWVRPLAVVGWMPLLLWLVFADLRGPHDSY